METNKLDENIDEKFMKTAYMEATKALKYDDVPIGAVIVRDNQVIAKAYNKRNHKNNTTSHAEIIAINKACKKLKDWRLEGCTMYVTLEPCQMCAGALVQSRIDRVVIGASSPKSGCCGSIINLLNNPDFNHQVNITYGVMEKDCEKIIKDFFAKLRKAH